MGNILVSAHYSFEQDGLVYRPILGSGTPLPTMSEMKISPSGAGSYFHAQKPVTYRSCNGVVPWIGTQITGLSGISDPMKHRDQIYVWVADGTHFYSFMAWWSWYWESNTPYHLYVQGICLSVPEVRDYAPVYRKHISTNYRMTDRLGSNEDLVPAILDVIASLPPYITWNSVADKDSARNEVIALDSDVEPAHFQFKYNELNDFLMYDEFGLWTHRWRALAGNAYINAAQNLPSTANNSIQNVAQIIDLIKDIKEGNLGRSARDFVKSNALSKAKEAWLTYRYSYETTKLDLQEYRQLTERIQSLRSLSKIETFGQYASDAALCRCCFKVNVSDIVPHNFSEWLHTYGFYLKAADVWDDIPFSFMVDWFLHLGDLLEFFDASGEAAEVRPADVWYSFLTKYDNQTCYFRIPGEAITNVPFLDFNTGSSTKVKAMRIADTISIFT